MRNRRPTWILPALWALALLAGCASVMEPPGGAGQGRETSPTATRPEASTAPGQSRSAPVIALAGRADAAFRAGRLAEAAAILERALRIDARDAEAWLALGWVRLAQGDAGQARVLADRARGLGGEDIACRADRLADARVTSREALAARDNARRDCAGKRG